MVVRFIQSILLLGGLALSAAAADTNGSPIDRSMFDSTCKPCEDFWRYANGGWVDKNPIPARKSSWGVMGLLKEANDERLRNILEAARSSKAPAGSNERKIGDYYAACMDEAAIDARGLKPVQPYLDRVAKIKTVKDLTAFFVSMQNEFAVGGPMLFAGPDLKSADDTIPNLLVMAMSLPERDYYLSKDPKQEAIRQEAKKYAAKLLELAGETPAKAQAAAEMILAFETKFAEVTPTNVEMRNPYARYHKMRLDEAAQLTPDFDWKPLFKAANVPETFPVNVMLLEPMKKFNALLKETPVEDWKTWLRFRILSATADDLPKAFRDEDFRFGQTVLRGVKEPEPRWQVCAQRVDGALGEALGQVFVEKHFPPAAKKRMDELVANIRATLGEELKTAAWLAPETRAAAVKKLEAFTPKIGYPSKWRDYSAVKVDPKKVFENSLSSAQANRKRNLEKIGKAPDRTEWGMTPPTVNAYYSPIRNEIAFPAGILQPPMFDLKADDALNYGAIGAVIGHEMGHGFDDQGSKFDAQGNLKNWWTESDRKQFDQRAACVIEQFDTLDVGSGRRHNGKLVVGEGMGDLGGLTIAYKAWRKTLEGKPEPPVVDGFTADQRFFLAFARVWATHYTGPETERRLKIDPHPLARFRVIGTLQNMPEFHKAFQCKQGDFMMRPPEKICKLW
jgi:predicted metalloendopeptidase